ncbi:MAG: YgiQ family radical SAM protein [Candidatus Aminicenantes bacterium]|nr:YgiQ family radical SAM protein [Candidatus Aminicenantes bacterium]
MAPFDVILVLPYPFSDHPSFPEGILKRALEAAGFTVGVSETPFWQGNKAFTERGRPRLFFAVVSGPIDSVVLNYTASRRRRREDLYQFSGQAFFPGRPLAIKYKIRPDRTLTVFASRLREIYRDTPVVIGGVEAGLRCFAHYDFQEEKVRRSILLDSRADILVHGSGEKQIVAIARRARAGERIADIDIPGTARIWRQLPPEKNCLELPSGEDIQADPTRLLRSQLLADRAVSAGRALAQKTATRWVVQNPAQNYDRHDLDFIYDLPYRRRHLRAEEYTPALQMNLFSVTAHRGCAGGCAFCSIHFSEGKRIVSRSPESILREIDSLAAHPRWQGVVSDIGGATAEMYGADCALESCSRISCLQPRPCRNFAPGEPYRQLLKRCRELKGVKKIFLGSGVRFDLLLNNPGLLEEIMRHHCGRFLRIAPEHTEDEVLDLLGKPRFAVLEEFVALFRRLNRRLPRPIELAPYWLIGHPGETKAHVPP